MAISTPLYFHINHKLLILFLFLAVFLSFSSPAKITYDDHCSSIVPQSPIAGPILDNTNYLFLTKGYFSGKDHSFSFSNLTFPASFRFYTHAHFATEKPGTFQLDGRLDFYGREWKRVQFNMTGFWSHSTGKICMVGPGSDMSAKGMGHSLTAVLKLDYPPNSNIYASLVRGTVDSLDAFDSPSRFDTISLLAYSGYNYSYTQMPSVKDTCSHVRVPAESLHVDSRNFCHLLRSIWDGWFELDYEKIRSSKYMNLNQIQCTEDGKVNMLIMFANRSRNYDYTDTMIPGSSFVGEGFWDLEKKSLCLVACKILRGNGSLFDSHIGECSTRLSLWFPAFFTIKNRNAVMGHLWSDKDKNDRRFFSMMSFSSTENMPTLPNLKYKYTKSNSLRTSCDNNNVIDMGGIRFPDGNINRDDMKFDLYVRDTDNNTRWGSATPFSFGETFYDTSFVVSEPAVDSKFTLEEASQRTKRVWNISYTIRLYSSSLTTEISAEGIYNSGTGNLCMVGCRILGFSEDSMDCEVHITIQISPLKRNDFENNRSTRHLYGTISSQREMHDPLHFDTLQLFSDTIYNTEAHELIQKIDIEITMVLISLTLSCIFIFSQLSYVTKNRHMLPSISTTMLVMLTLGHIIPPVLNIEALLSKFGSNKNVLLWSGGWLEAYEIIARVMTIVALFLNIRLLVIVWFSKSSEENRKGPVAAEAKTLVSFVSLYSVGAIIGLWIGYVHAPKNLIAYGGLMLDWFLLPQVMFNINWKSEGKALVPLFYIGITMVRALPRLYDVYRARSCVGYFDFFYIYANPDEGFYSTALDTIIPLVGVIFAVIIFLQQQFSY